MNLSDYPMIIFTPIAALKFNMPMRSWCLLTNESFDLFTSNLCDERHFILEHLFKEKNYMNINLHAFTY